MTARVYASFDDADAEREEDDADFEMEDGEGDAESEWTGSAVDEDELLALEEEANEAEPGNEEDTALSHNGELQERAASLDLSTLDKITAFIQAFPTAKVDEIERTLQILRGNMTKAYMQLAGSHLSALDLEDMLQYYQSLQNRSPTPKEEDGGDDNIDEADTAVHHSVRSLHSGIRGSSSRLSSSPQIPDAAALKVPEDTASDDDPAGVGVDDDDTSSDESSSDSDSDFDSDSDSGSGSDTGPDQELESPGPRSEDLDSAASEDSTSSTSEDDSDSGPELGSSKLPLATVARASPGTSSGETSSSEDTSDSDDDGDNDTSSEDHSDGDTSSEDDKGDDSSSSSGSVVEEPAKSPAPSAVQQITAVPRNANLLVQSEPQSEPQNEVSEAQRGLFTLGQQKEYVGVGGQGSSKTQKRNARRRAAKALKAAGQNKPGSEAQADQAMSAASLLEARKEALLDIIATSGSHTSGAPRDSAAELSGMASSVDSQGLDVESSPQRRLKLDLGAGRRMLFGALGLRNPKTKADEDKLRADLMKDIRPLVNPRVAGNSGTRASDAVTGDAQPGQSVAGENPETWRDKIAYSAVECCQDGVELSEPPFPFVQRWDPQQQADGRGRFGGKRKERNQSHFYEDERPPSVKRRRLGGSVNHPEDLDDDVDGRDRTDYNDSIILDYGDESAIPATVVEESQLTDMDDLPSLPHDLTTLPDLHPGEAKPGMVITWKQWLLSNATNWQPQLSSLTAVVTNTEEDDTSLRVVLAKRDRELDRNEKQYNKETGERIYSGFEAPDSSDEEDDTDGYRTILFSDLIEPRIVQLPIPQPPDDHNEDRQASFVLDTQKRDETGVQQPTDRRDGEPDCVTRDSPPLKPRVEETEGSPSIVKQNDGRTRDEHVTRGSIPREESVAESTRLVQVVANTDSILLNDPDDETSMMRSDATTQDEAPASPAYDEPPSFATDDHSGFSPSQQLEDMSVAAAETSVLAFREPSQPCGANTPQGGPSGMGSAADDADSPKVEYPRLNMQSSAGSFHSGRQPDLDFGPGLGGDSDQRLGGDDSSPRLAVTPRQSKARTNSSATSDSTSSSLPSLSEIWHTAETSRTTQSPARPVIPLPIKTYKSLAKDDPDYTQAMKQLDEVDKMSDRKESIVIKQSETQCSSNPEGIQSLDRPVSPPILPKTKRRSARRRSPFAIPAGSQVVSLLNSSPEPEYEENYADDSIDETYDEPSGVSQDSTWEQRERGGSRHNSGGSKAGAFHGRGFSASVQTERDVKPARATRSTRSTSRLYM